MTRKEYADWAKSYCAKFGINDPPGLEMVMSWFDVLSRHNATVADLIHVANTIKPQRREQHYGAMVGGLISLLYERRLRKDAERRKTEADDKAPDGYWQHLREKSGQLSKHKTAKAH